MQTHQSLAPLVDARHDRIVRRDFIFKRNFPIHKLFERSCELGLWRLTAHKISEIFGQ